MRTEKEINEGLAIYYTDDNGIIAVQDNYDHSVARINSTIKYLKRLLPVPPLSEIRIEVLDRPRYQRVMSIEFTCKVPIPDSVKNHKQFTYLSPDSGLWSWLNKC